MPYAQYRKQLIDATYDARLNRFLARFDPTWPTVILLPGGMGSQLERSRRKYPATGNVIDETVWLDEGVLLASDALKLEVVGDSEADKGQFVICGDGPLHFLSNTPYDAFLAFAARQQWNAVVFGYDWRRPVPESAAFLRAFVGKLRTRVESAFPGFDFMPTVTLVAHSMGGMVATLALREPAFGKLPFNAIVTVATPFYGTATHQARYYIGESLLNLFYTADIVADLIASLPGPYSLMFMPKAVYDRDGTLMTELDRYPQLDAKTGGPGDPFDKAFRKRWRPAVRKHFRHVDANRETMIELTKPLLPEAQARFFNVRSIGDPQTARHLIWEDVDGDAFFPGSGQSPLRVVNGPGDGTVPGFSAFHAHSLPAHRHTLIYAKDHGLLLEHPETMEVIASVVKKRPFRFPAAATAETMAAAPEVIPFEATAKVLKESVEAKNAGLAMSAGLFTAPVARGLFSQIIW